MLKSNIKLAWRAFFIFTTVFFQFAMLYQPAQADSPFPSDWSYYKKLTLYGSSAGVQTDYPKLIRVYKSTGTSTAENIAQYTANDDSSAAFYGATWIGQTFVAETTATAKKVWVKLSKTGSPSVSTACAIRATAAGVPTGANLCSGNITSSFISTTADWYEFDMGTGTTLTAGTTYAVILYGSDNTTDCINARLDGSMPAYTGGSYVTSSNSGGAWTADTSKDLIFQVLTSVTGSIPLAVYLDNHCKDDFSDIRFISSDNSTLLDYWIESYVYGNYADIWVKVPTIPALANLNESVIVGILYGNSNAVSASSGSDVFTQFDDFDSYVLGSNINGQGGWIATAGSATASNEQFVSGTRSMKLAGTAGAVEAYRTLTADNQIYLYSYKMYKDDAAQMVVQHGNGITQTQIAIASTEAIFYYNYTGSAVFSGWTATADAWDRYSYYSYIFNTSVIMGFTTAAGVSGSMTQGLMSSSVNNNVIRLLNNVSGANNDSYIDDFFVAKFAVSQPLWGVPSAESAWVSPLEIQDVKVFLSYKNDGDWLITIRYLDIYAPYYDTYDVRKYFVAQLIDNVGTVIAQTSIPAWGNKVGNIYLSADQVSGLTYGSSYKIRIYGTFTGNPYAEYTLTADDWLGNDLSQLDSWIITSASVIGNYYDDLLTTYISGRGEVLNATGGAVFTAGINGLSTVRPELFQVYTSPIDYTGETTDQTFRQSVAAYETTWGADGALMLQRIENWLGIDGGYIGGMFFVIMMLALAILAFPAGHTTAANILSIPCLGLAVFFGLDLVWLIMLALFAAFLLFKNMFMDK